MGVSRFLRYTAKAEAEAAACLKFYEEGRERGGGGGGGGGGTMFWGLARASLVARTQAGTHARAARARKARDRAVLCYQAISRGGRSSRSVIWGELAAAVAAAASAALDKNR